MKIKKGLKHGSQTINWQNYLVHREWNLTFPPINSACSPCSLRVETLKQRDKINIDTLCVCVYVCAYVRVWLHVCMAYTQQVVWLNFPSNKLSLQLLTLLPQSWDLKRMGQILTLCVCVRARVCVAYTQPVVIDGSSTLSHLSRNVSGFPQCTK